MAVRLPDATALGPVADNFQSGRPIGPGPENYIGPAVEKLGRAGEQAASDLGYQLQKEQSFDAAARFQQFQNTQEDLARKARENMPVGGNGLTSTFREQYKQAAGDFIKTLPSGMQARFQPHLLNLEGNLASTLGTAEAAEQQRYALVQEGDRVNANITLARNDPGNADLQKKLMLQDQQRIDANPGLTPVQRETAKHNLTAMYAAGINPAMAADGGVVKNLFGVQQEQSPGPPAPRLGHPFHAAPSQTKIDAITKAANNLGVSPTDLATVVMYESSGDANRWGGTGGNYFGVIQFGPEERKKYGVHPGMSFENQMDAAEKFLRDRGVKPGMGLMDLYSTVNAGSPGHYDASDGNGTVRSHVAAMQAAASQKQVAAFMGGQYNPSQSTASLGPEGYQTASRYVEERFPGLDPDSVNKMANSLVDAHTAFLTQDKAEAAAAEQQRKGLVDQYQYSARNGQLGESDIEQGWQNGIFKTYEEYSSVRAARKEYLTERDQGAGAVEQVFGGGGGNFNQFDDENKKVSDNAYKEIVRTNPDKAIEAIDAIYQRRGVVPKTAANGMRAAIYGTDQNTAGQALQVAANLMTRNPNAFTGVEGGDAISKSAVAYRHYIDQGASTADAVRRVMEQNDPAYRSKVSVKDADLKTFSDGITPATIGHLYDTNSSWLPLGDPRVGVSPQQQGAITQDFKEVAEQFYRESGDPSLAMAQAKAQLDKVYGVTTAFGTATLTKYPAQKSYPSVSEGPGSGGYEYIYRQAAEAVKAATGKDIPPTDIALLQTPNGETAQAFGAGKPAPYLLAYVDRSSGQPVLEYIYGPNGKAAFVADPAEAQQAVQDGRAASFKAAQDAHQALTQPMQPKDAGHATWQDVPEVVSGGGGTRKLTQEERQAIADQRNAEADLRRQSLTGLPPVSQDTRNYMYGSQSDYGVHDVQPSYPTPPPGQMPFFGPFTPPADAMQSSPAWRPGQQENPPPFERQGAPSDIPTDPQAAYQRDLQQRQGEVNDRRAKMGLPSAYPDIPTSRESAIQHEDVGGGDITVIGGKENQGFLSWATGQDAEQRSLKANPMTAWPTDAEAANALKNGQFYGQDEAFLSGSKANVVGETATSPATMAKGSNTYPQVFKPEIMVGRMSAIFDKLDSGTKSKLMATDPETRNSIVKSALVANRIPLAALGFDPRKFFVEVAQGRDVPMEARTLLTVAGAYDPKTDTALSNTSYNSNIVHESIHRGIEMLRRAYPDEMKKLEETLPKEESIVRYTMIKQAGNPEPGRGEEGDRQIEEARRSFEDTLGSDEVHALEKVNALAAQLYVKQHGKGPK